MLTDAQLQTLAAGLRAEPSIAALVAARNDYWLAAWCNAESTQAAWRERMTGAELFETTDVTKFDGITAGKRDAWRLMLDFAPVDFTRQKNRKAAVDVWGNTDSVAVLQAATRFATNGEKILGGADATTNTVTAWKLNYAGSVAINDVSSALNRF